VTTVEQVAVEQVAVGQTAVEQGAVEQGAEPQTQPGLTPRSPVSELERQVERGSMFTQAVFQKSFTRLSLVEAALREVVDVLVARGVVSGDDLTDAQAALQESEPHSDEVGSPLAALPWPAVAIRVDPVEEEQLEPVDCAARLPVCQAVCCRLKFALSQDEVEKGRVKWDIGHPYVIRQDSTGYCCHNEVPTHRCTVYEDRPRLCQRYSCRGDSRIWTDFDGMVLNSEWINDHLGEGDAILLVDADDDTP
jgi:Fe-S-cluster containining protein